MVQASTQFLLGGGSLDVNDYALHTGEREFITLFFLCLDFSFVLEGLNREDM